MGAHSVASAGVKVACPFASVGVDASVLLAFIGSFIRGTETCVSDFAGHFTRLNPTIGFSAEANGNPDKAKATEVASR